MRKSPPYLGSALLRRNGALVMLSIPPATITSTAPLAMFCAASIMAFIPEAHSLLTVVVDVDSKHISK